ncbi:uncharacterized protein BX664DRAFT_288849 [Halteromyces radiatus]|uniref:uncharacterized protein n=1 Tax=Halteromyces radiatus TaxID=101107 RepID=UPI002220FE39|nr:uncharacterized protein BX664DRAFT_288849 [Halteromyces radiatus]KAI8098999.1 hypothetical protein BX664DRAFT_288849 [Halteromyces radiatus]
MAFPLITRTCYRYVNTKRILNINHGHLLSRNIRCFSTSFPRWTQVSNTATSTTTDPGRLDHLRLIFDDPVLWKQYQQLSPVIMSPQKTGLMEHPYFVDAEGFDYAAQQAIQRAQILVERICNAPNNGLEEMQRVVKNLDRLSDTLCIVIDLAEFLRNAHPDPILLDAANKAYTDLCTYMNTLNTDTRIHKVLAQVLENKAIVSQFTPDEHAAAIVFLRDFEKSGIHLPDKQRNQFVELSDRIIQLGREFIQRNPRGISQIKIAKQDLDGVGPSLSHTLNSSDGHAHISTSSMECQLILKYAHNEQVRKQVYESINSANKKSVMILEWLMQTRAELADLVGQKSYADLHLQDKMAKSPVNVDAFLRTLLKHQAPTNANDIQVLQYTKQHHLGLSTPPIVNAWDRDYYMHLHNLSQPRLSSSLPYFSVGSVIQGLSRLFDHLYGVHFEPTHMQPGESWHEDVRKLDVICEKEGKIGTIYCDLYSRPGKTTNAAHYTIRTSRRLDDDDQANDLRYAFPNESTAPAQFLPPLDSNHLAATVIGRPGLYQLPVIALTCDFSNNNNNKSRTSPGLLSMFEVETLFHEMGHAMHSMLGRTDFHNVSGTRCATDFVELPSILMERFVSHPKVLPLFAHNDDSISPEAVNGYLQQRQRFSGIEINNQVLMSMVDQQYHSTSASSKVSTVETWHQLQDDVGLFPSVPGTMWPVQFGHLFGYGAGYYSYLFDRTLAQRVWDRCFATDPLDREKGLAFRDQVLKWGGARDPWQCVAGVLGDEDGERIVHGDEEAMRTVGDWGIDM